MPYELKCYKSNRKDFLSVVYELNHFMSFLQIKPPIKHWYMYFSLCFKNKKGLSNELK